MCKNSSVGRWLTAGILVLVLTSSAAARPFNPELLLPAGDRNRHPRDRAVTALQCIHTEVTNPSDGRLTISSTRHERVLRWMLEFLGHDSNRYGIDLEVVRQSSATAVGEEREVLMLLRGMLKDGSVTEMVEAYLANPQKPAYLRVVAAQALGTLQAPRSIDLLTGVLEHDQAWEKADKRVVTSNQSTCKHYLVRDAAFSALHQYNQNQLLPKEAKRRLQHAVLSEEFK